MREQLEHDRLIRFLQARYKRKFEAAINTGDEQAVPVKFGTATMFPDLVLTEGKKLSGLVEVETGESVNNLEAMAQWVPFAKVRAPFSLYVPVQGYDAARRLCETHQVKVAEIWTYRPATDGFDLVRLFHDPSAGGARRPAPEKTAAAKAKKNGAAKAKPAPRPSPAKRRAAASKPAKRPAKKPAKR